ncbi:hypothetical protein FOZ63_019054 [Perkinsus olseni]|uniref:Ribosome recycling factor domain-containing protein n=1 Tax=Perkinsus olseni TaxID=32597 RepID=A0A7J6TP01_PEROL|nr:hypothetical protein FOZ63_019054 [Perkinsus olseni]
MPSHPIDVEMGGVSSELENTPLKNDGLAGSSLTLQFAIFFFWVGGWGLCDTLVGLVSHNPFAQIGASRLTLALFGAPSLLTEPTVSVTDRFGARGFAKKSPPKQKTKEEKQQSAQRKKDLRDRREADKFLSLEDTKSVGSLTPAERRQQRLDQKMEHANMLKEQTQALDDEVKEMKSALQEVQVEQASPELFRSITVAEKPLLSISQMSIVNATTVNFSVFDDGLAGACQKAIQLRGKNWTISVVLPKVTREVRNECLNRCKGILKKYQRNVNSIKGSMLEENRRMMPSTEMEKTEAAKIEKICKQRADQLVALLREKEQAMSKAA